MVEVNRSVLHSSHTPLYCLSVPAVHEAQTISDDSLERPLLPRDSLIVSRRRVEILSLVGGSCCCAVGSAVPGGMGKGWAHPLTSGGVSISVVWATQVRSKVLGIGLSEFLQAQEKLN